MYIGRLKKINMKKYPCYLLVLLLLLSACKQQGEAKITITVATPDSQRADAGAALYFIPANATSLNWLGLNFGCTTPYMLIKKYDNDSISAMETITKATLLLANKNISTSDAKFYTNIIDTLQEIQIRKRELNNTMILKNDSAKVLLAKLIKDGVKATADANGVCIADLKPGKYNVLIESNYLRNFKADPAFERYALDSIIILAGQTTTLTRNLKNCED